MEESGSILGGIVSILGETEKQRKTKKNPLTYKQTFINQILGNSFGRSKFTAPLFALFFL